MDRIELSVRNACCSFVQYTASVPAPSMPHPVISVPDIAVLCALAQHCIRPAMRVYCMERHGSSAQGCA